jgi:tetratricopeptide (TPR) repeat protein
MKAFVARSFAADDDQRIRPILDFLTTFHKAGFFWETAEPAEVESVSVKVRRLIDASDVFIGFFTRRYPVFDFKSPFDTARRAFFRTLVPRLWSAPPWVIQESGYALRSPKPLILLREKGVEVFGLQGDLEYIEFDGANPAQAFPKLSEMINALLAKTSGTEVAFVVTDRTEPAQFAIEATQPEAKQDTEPRGDTEDNIYLFYYDMVVASDKRRFEDLDGAWTAGKGLLPDRDSGHDELSWDCLYYALRFNAGSSDALETLRALERANPTRPEPLSAIARCMSYASEHESAAQLFIRASTLQHGTKKIHNLLGAARAFVQVKQYEAGKKAVDEALALELSPSLRDEAITLKYELLKESGDKMIAFATAETALAENPQLSLRFSLGLDYNRQSHPELALYHFHFLYQRNHDNIPALHNLALMCSENNLPILSVTQYKQAFERGESLSAANLGFMYLDAGMAQEAKTIIERAIEIDGHPARVEKCVTQIIERQEQEETKQTELLTSADATRRMFISIGSALTVEPPNVAGTWNFPFGEIVLTRVASELVGDAEISVENQFRYLLQISSSLKDRRTEIYSFKGTMLGSCCKFELTSQEKIDPVPPGSLGLPMAFALTPSTTKSGFIVFDGNGRSATYIEITDGKLSKPELISRSK